MSKRIGLLIAAMLMAMGTTLTLIGTGFPTTFREWTGVAISLGALAWMLLLASRS